MGDRLAGALVAVCMLATTASDATACSALEGTAPEWIDRAEIIIRARAVEQVEGAVRFELIEILKGTAPSVLRFEGEFVSWADSNDSGLPPAMVRRGGRRGTCYAKNYSKSAEYLLMLKTRSGVLTPYWAAMAATNEQLTGPDDPWLGWVRAHLDLRRLNPTLQGTMPASCPESMDLHPEMSCRFTVGSAQYELSGTGRLRRVSGRGGPREARMPMTFGSLEGVKAAAYEGDVLLTYELGDHDSGAGMAVRLDGTTLAVKWQRPIPGFNVSLAAIEGTRMYVAAIGVVAAIDLDTGAFAWKHERLYDGVTFAFNSFKRPIVKPDEVFYFDSDRPSHIRVNKQSGAMTVLINPIGGIIGPGLSSMIEPGEIWRGIVTLRQSPTGYSPGVVFGAHSRAGHPVVLSSGRHTVAFRCGGRWSEPQVFFWEEKSH